MKHARHLAGHDAAGDHVAVKHGAAQAAQGAALQLLQAGPPALQSQVFPGHLVLQHPHGTADGAAGYGGVAVLGLQQGQLIVLVNGALLAHQEAGAHLDAAGPQGQGCRHLTAVGDAARPQ